MVNRLIENGTSTNTFPHPTSSLTTSWLDGGDVLFIRFSIKLSTPSVCKVVYVKWNYYKEFMRFFKNRKYRRVINILLILCITITLIDRLYPHLIGYHAGLRSYISMYPTFEASDKIWVNKISYRFSSPTRGDVILVRDVTGLRRDPEERYIELIHPFYWNMKLNKFAISPPFGSKGPTWVKRIIGLPGETIKIVDKQVYINSEPFNYGTEVFYDDRIIPFLWRDSLEPEFIEKNRSHVEFLERRDNMGSLFIPEGYYFIMGDFRDNSRDSRHFGLVAKRDILGRITHKAYSHRDGRVQYFRQVK